MFENQSVVRNMCQQKDIQLLNRDEKGTVDWDTFLLLFNVWKPPGNLHHSRLVRREGGL